MNDAWFYAKFNQQHGPVTNAALRDLFNAGHVAPADLVWTEGMPQWLPAATVFAPSTATPGPLNYYNTQANTTVTYAGFWIRFVAALIDGILLFVVSVLANCALAIPMGAVGGTGLDDARMNRLSNLMGIILSWLYYALMESSSWQASLGKRALGLRVTTEDGARISFGRASGRYFMSIVSTLMLLVGYIMGAFTERKQTLHDIVAKTLVIKPEPMYTPQSGFAVVAAPQGPTGGRL